MPQNAPIQDPTPANPVPIKLTTSFTSELSADKSQSTMPRQVAGAAFSRTNPATFSQPTLVSWNADLASQLGLEELTNEPAYAANVFSGQRLLEGSDPYAMAYGGHQFGNWAGQLGDGRAIALGDVTQADGTLRTLQLKGAGPTPYSRRADGLAVLRSSIREYLASEAMFHLGVPTTRALSLVLTGDQVLRDMLYDGNPALEPGAIVCRTAESFIRFGNFELPTSRGDIDQLRELADYTIRHHFGHLSDAQNPTAETYVEWFEEICQSTAKLMVDWLRVGFVHGVMNTDNMSIHGITIDYGPYGWVDDFDPAWTPNTTDSTHRRYRFGNQGAVGQWNVLQLANALVPLVEETTALEKAVNDYVPTFKSLHQAMMADKIGLQYSPASEDTDIVEELLQILASTETDMTIFYRRLATIDADTKDPLNAISDAYYDQTTLVGETRERINNWMQSYQKLLPTVGSDAAAQRTTLMNSVNPCYVLRNYLAQETIDAATEGDFSRMDQLAKVLENPYEQQAGAEKFAEKRPDWARNRAGCSMLSCSS